MRFALWSVILAVAFRSWRSSRATPGYVVIVSAPYRIRAVAEPPDLPDPGGYLAFYALARMIATLAAIPARVRSYRSERQRSRLRQA